MLHPTDGLLPPYGSGRLLAARALHALHRSRRHEVRLRYVALASGAAALAACTDAAEIPEALAALRYSARHAPAFARTGDRPLSGRDYRRVAARHGQSELAITRFWSPIVISALSETVDRASLAAARKVFADGMAASRTAADLLVPQAPLVELFDTRLGSWLRAHRVKVHRATHVRHIEGDARLAKPWSLPTDLVASSTC